MDVVRLSSKGQVVIPKHVRERLGLGDGDRLKLSVEAKRIMLVPLTELSEEFFVKGGAEAVKEALKEARKIDERKLVELLSALGVKY
jgi:AbrB family looped-hinge helix DNA binding protein